MNRVNVVRFVVVILGEDFDEIRVDFYYLSLMGILEFIVMLELVFGEVGVVEIGVKLWGDSYYVCLVFKSVLVFEIGFDGDVGVIIWLSIKVE